MTSPLRGVADGVCTSSAAGKTYLMGSCVELSSVCAGGVRVLRVRGGSQADVLAMWGALAGSPTRGNERWPTP